MNNRHIVSLLFFLLSSLLPGACSPSQRQQLSLQAATEIHLSHPGHATVHGLDLELQGQGFGKLTLQEAGQTYRQWLVRGNFQNSYHGDWYAPGTQLQWQPQPGHVQGQLQIRWRFRD